MSRSGTSDEDFGRIVADALAGDTHAQVSLSELLLPAIRTAVHARISTLKNRPALAEEDIVQATWLRLLEKDGRALRSHDPAISHPLTYVGRIAEKVVCDFARKKQLLVTGGHNFERIADPVTSVEGRVLARDHARKLHAWLSSLIPARGLAIYALYFVDACTTREVASALGVSEQVVYNWVFKIRCLARELP